MMVESQMDIAANVTAGSTDVEDEEDLQTSVEVPSLQYLC